MDFPIPTSAFGRTIQHVSALFKQHEKLIAVVVAAALIWGVSGKVQDMIVAHDQKVYDARTATLQAQADKNAALAQQNATLASDYKAFAQQAQAANQQLEQANAKLTDALKTRQAVDSTLPPADLAARIEELSNLPANSITPQPGDTFSVAAPAAVAIAQDLESLPVLTDQLTNLQTEKSNVDKQLAKQGAVVTGLNQQVSGLQLQIVDGDKACKAQVSLEKAKAARSKRKWFVAGYISGLATRGIIKIFGGV